MPASWKTALFSFCSLFLLPQADAKSFWVDYSPQVNLGDALCHDISILSAETKADVKQIQARGGKCFGYLSTVEVASDAAWKKDLPAAGVKLLGENKTWKNQCADVSQPAWQDYVVNKLAAQLSAKGFEGFFLDTADSVHFLKEAEPKRAEEFDKGLVTLIKKLKATYPDKEIILNRGFAFLPELKGVISGVMIESVFRSFEGEKYVAVAPEVTSRLLKQIQEIRSLGMPVYVLDYIPASDAALAEATAAKIREAGAEPFLTTPGLQGEMLGPIRRMPRRVLLLYGSVEAEADSLRKFETDTFMANRLQMPLEWMGYEVEYLDVGKISPPQVLDSRFCGVVFDVDVKLPFGGEGWYVDWILDHVSRGIKMLFIGQYPFDQKIQAARLFKGLGLWGTFNMAATPENVKFRMIDKNVMDYEGALTAHPAEVEDIRAPESAQVDLSVSCRDGARNPIICDAIFSTSWGGAVLEPYATFQATAEDQASLFNPFKYLPRIFPTGKFPAPDTSTRDGRRIFYSHIDGDGFCGVSAYEGKRICGEVVRDNILTKYPFPITVSLVEASTRALEPHQKFEDLPRYEDVAKSCFALPNVQAASHAFSHPYVWIDEDNEYIPLYSTRGLLLKPEANYDPNHPTPEREIRDSAAYINTLCPPGKKVDLMLWSGNCRPGEKMLKMCDDLGIENMNGGMTVMSKRHPFVSNISSRTMTWNGRLQIHAANQNEFVYTKNWKGPFFGGFRKLIETFEYTEAPYRVKPVNIYYHFYSSATEGALKALKEVHDWSLKQPLHSMTAVDFARMTRDSYETSIYQAGPREWRLVNRGMQRTFRVDKDLGIPDLAQSRGVLGWCELNGQHLIHMDGRPSVKLIFQDKQVPHLYLENSQGELTWKTFTRDRLSFTVTELRPKHTISIGTGTAGSTWSLSINGTKKSATADAAGKLEIALAGNAEVMVEP